MPRGMDQSGFRPTMVLSPAEIHPHHGYALFWMRTKEIHMEKEGQNESLAKDRAKYIYDVLRKEYVASILTGS